MIIQLKGKVNYAITLDPTVWIFDDRKIIFDEAFNDQVEIEDADHLAKAAERFNQEVYTRTVRPPVNKSINRFEKEKILTNTYCMPIYDFINHAEIQPEASNAILKTDGEDVIITTEQLENSLFLFAVKGKPLLNDGPIHLYFGDGSNKENPIKSVKQITIV